MPITVPTYENDGSGRDTFINHAGAYWMNPLPGGTYHKSLRTAAGAGAATLSGSSRGAMLAETIDPFASVRPPGQDLFGKSRYGTTVLQSTELEAGSSADGVARRVNGFGTAVPRDGAPADGGDFDPEATALATIPDDVANPGRRLMTPGHATVVPSPNDGTGGLGGTFTGGPEAWRAPRQVDNTLLRLKPTYESTCHYGLRTGRVYVPAEAPDPEVTLLDKSKTRYY